MRKWITVILFIAGLSCGCTIQDPTIHSEEIVTTEISTAPQAYEPTEIKPPAPTETIYYLDIEPGAHFLNFVDETTGDYLDYYLFVPENATEELPLLVFLHGDGEVGYPERLENFGPMIHAKEIYGNEFLFIALFPCTRTYSWISGYIPGTLKELIDSTVETYHIDADRIIITGHSRGAIGVWHMISMYGEYFSAAVPISCGPATPLDFDSCVNVPICGFVGNIGELEINYSRAMKWSVDQIVEHGGTAQLRILENTDHGNTSTEAFSEEIFLWMLSQ